MPRWVKPEITVGNIASMVTVLLSLLIGSAIWVSQSDHARSQQAGELALLRKDVDGLKASHSAKVSEGEAADARQDNRIVVVETDIRYIREALQRIERAIGTAR